MAAGDKTTYLGIFLPSTLSIESWINKIKDDKIPLSGSMLAKIKRSLDNRFASISQCYLSNIKVIACTFVFTRIERESFVQTVE